MPQVSHLHAVVEGDPEGRDDLFELVESGGGGAVGEHQPVHHEVAVVDDFAEVAAVAEEFDAVGGAGAQAVVAPLPDEPAVQPRILVEQRLILVQPARPVAHRVRVFAEQERLGSLPRRLRHRATQQGFERVASDRRRLGHRGVHPRIHIGVGAGMIALVVHGAPGVAVMHPGRHRSQIRAGAGLVAQRPQHDRGMVLVPLDSPFDAVQQGVAPRRVIAGIPGPAARFEAVGLQVALQDHPEAQLIAQVEQPRMRGIVTGPDRVHVEPLHQGEILTGPGLVEDPAAIGMGFVPVHAVEHHPATVDQQPVAVDRHGAETQPQRHRLAGAAHRDLVEPGELRRPRLHPVDSHRRHFGRRRPDGFDAQLRDPQSDRVGVRFGHDLWCEQPHPSGVVATQPDIVQAKCRAGQQGHVAEDARQPPLVLVLQVAARRPLMHPHHQQIRARPDGVRHVELLRQPTARTDPDLDAVEPHPVPRLDPVEAQQHRPGVAERGRQVEPSPVVTGRVVVRHVRRIDRERELHIGVDRTAVASITLQHPV